MRGRVVRVALVAILGVVLTAASLASASGTYRGGSPRRSAMNNFGKYELGKKIATGEIVPGDEARNDPEQLRILGELHQKLPASAQARLDFKPFAGRLSADQLEAVRYYVTVRYRIR